MSNKTKVSAKTKISAENKKHIKATLKKAKDIMEEKVDGIVLVADVEKDGDKSMGANLSAVVRHMKPHEVNKTLEGFKRRAGISEESETLDKEADEIKEMIKAEESLSEKLDKAIKEADEIKDMIKVGKNYLKEARRYNRRALLFFVLGLSSIFVLEWLNPSSWFLLGTFALVVIGSYASYEASTLEGKAEGITEVVVMIMKNKITNVLK